MLQKASGSPDYQAMPIEQAMADLQSRITNYEKVYETIEDDSVSYIKLINLQSKVICNRIFGSIPQSTATFLMSLNISDRAIWFTRPGQVQGAEGFNTPGAEENGPVVISPEQLVFSTLSRRLSRGNIFPKAQLFEGANFQSQTDAVNLNDSGQLFALKLKEFVAQRVSKTSDVQIYTSMAPRAVQTAVVLRGRSQPWSALNNLDSGILDGMSYSQIKTQYSAEFEDFKRDPYHCRLPGGESFGDVIHRTEPFVIELERQTKPCLVVSHLSTLRVLLGYFLGIPSDQLSSIDVPQHTVIELVPSQYGWKQTLFPLL